jgi:hypothetical protein
MPNKFVNTIYLGHSVIGMREDGILEMDFSDTLEIDLKEAKEMVAATATLSGGKKVLVLNIAGSITTATTAARDFAASAEAIQYTLAEAYVVNNLAQKIVGNFYVNFHKPQVPTKIFTNTEEAVNWLKSLNL